MLKINELSVKIDGKNILNNISIELDLSNIIALLWPNWSWKTTLLKSIMWLIKSKWSIIFNWENINWKKIYNISRMWIWYIMQEVPEYFWIKIYDYIKNILDLEKKFDEYKISYYFDLFWLDWEFYKNRHFNANLSWWEKKKIEIITTFLLDKDIYLLDEIESFLDVTSRQILLKIIKDLKKDWKSFILVSHNEEIISIADSAILLCNWQIKIKWKTDELLKLYTNKCKWCDFIKDKCKIV